MNETAITTVVNHNECYALKNGTLVEIACPIEIYPEHADAHTNIVANGYGLELTTEPETGWAQSSICLYRAFDRALQKGKPLYYIEIFGQSSLFATLVANTFLELLEVLRVAQPLTDLIGKELTAGIHDLSQ
ncbi:hypothetical protein [Pseudogulbenkiania subflava]|uniref:Uncharacterized protein n=1 Tax=Pseudogulbenkiania subflava DSM 22618 TaxID=1123014 RepID=A0A1Y6BWP9_9NEIS|nr:hypothetical protein [Pseudogulbenkiania subflava]SMF23666.1 hypothetical protein SAMN02745746_02069 [Pseudogulbenkiania subflava DSM 22618]SMF33031.1 hypothetical protein SAMN02745746_02617 [Pseudogulbenkiania subflava DSM 22618]SMF48014.1 hypothetical protein SAMN02745746_03546 [Pseudogulbenkiania subflava DSM 22618]